MLKQLSISNYILIEDIKISFREGLTIITGETGAGKSIFLGALRLIMGERAEVKVLRNEEKKCVIEALFDLEQLDLHSFFIENDIDYEKETIIRREIMPNGKSRIFINDSPVTLGIVHQLTHKLLDIHSQFSNNQLRDPHFHLQIIDSLVPNKSLFKSYSEKLKSYKKIEKRWNELTQNKSNENQTKEYNAFLLDELLKSNLTENELVELENEQKLLSNATEILSSLDKSVFMLDNDQTGVIYYLNEVLQQINKTASENTHIHGLKERINSVRIEIQDILNEINSFSSKIEVNPNKLEEINQRITLIYQLQKKHKVLTIKELLEIQSELEQSVFGLENLDIEIEKLTLEKANLHQELTEIANKISEERKRISPIVEQELEKTLVRMGLENAHFWVSIENEELTNTGQDKIKLFFCANKGGRLESIEKVASGGEIARVSLAIKKLLAAHYKLPSLLLDEIDTGISGKIAHQMGEIMQEMAVDMQVFTITHNPQIAAKGSEHLKVYKKVEQQKTNTYIKSLSKEEKIAEIAQLISGNTISESALAQAKELVGI